MISVHLKFSVVLGFYSIRFTYSTHVLGQQFVLFVKQKMIIFVTYATVCGQITFNFRFFSCGGQNYCVGCPSCFYAPFMELTKNERKGQNNFLTYHIQKKVSARPSEKCHFRAFFGGSVEAFRGKLAKLGVDN